MSVLTLPSYSVRPIAHVEAQPYVLRYCAKWQLPFDPIRFASSTWWGAFKGDAETASAVMGLEPMPNKSVFIDGFYSDDTRDGKRGLRKLCEFIDAIEAPVFATILHKNVVMQDFLLVHLSKRHKRKFEIAAHVVYSPNPWEEPKQA